LAKVSGHSLGQRFTGFAMTKIFTIAALLSLSFASQALASTCQDDVAKIDAALTTTQLDADQKTEVSDLRNQAVQLCGAGNEQEGLDVTAQAKTLLNIE
jgi:hypothetical protein